MFRWTLCGLSTNIRNSSVSKQQDEYQFAYGFVQELSSRLIAFISAGGVETIFPEQHWDVLPEAAHGVLRALM